MLTLRQLQAALELSTRSYVNVCSLYGGNCSARAIARWLDMHLQRQFSTRLNYEGRIDLLLSSAEAVPDGRGKVAYRRMTLGVHGELDREGARIGSGYAILARDAEVRCFDVLWQIFRFAIPENDGRSIDSVDSTSACIPRRIELGSCSKPTAHIGTKCRQSRSHMARARLHVAVRIHSDVDADIHQLVLPDASARPIVDAGEPIVVHRGDRG